MNAFTHKLLDKFTIWVCGTGVGLLVADVVLGSYNSGLTSFPPKVFSMLLLAACTAAALLSKSRWNPATLWVLAMPAAMLFEVFFIRRCPETGAEDVAMNCVRGMMGALSMAALLATPAGAAAMRWAAMVAICMTTGSTLYEFAGFHVFSSIPGRTSGFNGHPNSAPIMMCEAVGVLMVLNPHFRQNCLMIAIGLPGVALTFGRSGTLVYVVLCSCYVLLNLRRHLGFAIVIALIAVPALSAGLAMLQTATYHGGKKNQDTAGRWEAIFNLDTDKLGSSERTAVLKEALEAVAENPIAGYGVGAASTRWQPHNEFLATWIELGLFGLLLHVAVMGSLVLRSIMRRGLAAGLVFAIVAFSFTAQGRYHDPHLYFGLLAAAHVLWSTRVGFRLAHSAEADRGSRGEAIHSAKQPSFPSSS